MYPVLFELGSLKIYSWGFMLAIAVLIAIWGIGRLFDQEGYDKDAVFEMIILMVICGSVSYTHLDVYKRQIMYILAIDSATPVAGVALLRDESLIVETFANIGLTHSETLMPMVDRVLKDAGLPVGQLHAIAVTIGPGSFTGLRIGLAAAKGLALAADKPLIGISTLEALAHNLSYSSLPVSYTHLDVYKRQPFYPMLPIAPDLSMPWFKRCETVVMMG